MFSQEPLVLTEGAIAERLRRMPEIELDPHVAQASLIYDRRGREVLACLYREYLDIGQAHGLPMILLTPTRRAHRSRIERAGITTAGRRRDLNRDCVRFLTEIRTEYGDYGDQIAIGGVVGCAGDAYRPEDALGRDAAAAFHREQLATLAGAGVDFLIAATLPAFSEAAGLARAMAGLGRPGMLSFVVRASGTLLDGTPFTDAVRRLDDAGEPLDLLVNCVHPSIFRRAIETAGLEERIAGLMANTSARSPAELDGRAELDTMPPEAFADAMATLHEELGTRILGGCCGTDRHHLAALAHRLRPPLRIDP